MEMVKCGRWTTTRIQKKGLLLKRMYKEGGRGGEAAAKFVAYYNKPISYTQINTRTEGSLRNCFGGWSTTRGPKSLLKVI